MKTMTINGKTYVEVSSANMRDQDLCKKCALGLFGEFAACTVALDGAAKAAFGGNCDDRDVIYKQQPTKAAK